MQLKTKKIVAREFVIFMVSILVGILCSLFIFSYNHYKNNKLDSLTKNINETTTQANKLASAYISKTGRKQWFFYRYKDAFNVHVDNRYNSSTGVWDMLERLAKNDSIQYKWEHVWDNELLSFIKNLGFNDYNSFETFIESNVINDVDFENHKKSLSLRPKIDSLSSERSKVQSQIFSTEEQVDILIKTLILQAICFFLLRYLFYALRWSLKTLKQKTD